jgi:hypothetical protein
MHTPGIKVVLPSTPYDAKGLLVSALADDNPVLFLEHKMLYGSASPGGGRPPPTPTIGQLGRVVPGRPYAIPLGKADIKRAGRDVTVVATAVTVHRSPGSGQPAGWPRDRGGGHRPDARWYRWTARQILASLRRTHRIVVVTEDTRRAGVGAELMATILEEGFDELDAACDPRLCRRYARSHLRQLPRTTRSPTPPISWPQSAACWSNAMPTSVLAPILGEAISEARVTTWLEQIGDPVRGDELGRAGDRQSSSGTGMPCRRSVRKF